MTAQILNGNALAKSTVSGCVSLFKTGLRKGVDPRIGQSRWRRPGIRRLRESKAPRLRGSRRLLRALHLDADIGQAELEAHIDELNGDPAIDGILVQSPLSPHHDEDRIIDRILPNKDVDGFHAYNIGRLALRRPTLRSCTPMGVMQMLDHIKTDYKGLHATIIGASNHVGRPMGLELLLAGVTVTTAHKFTKDTGEMARQADILISAVGSLDWFPGSGSRKAQRLSTWA